MILSDKSIREAIDSGRLGIDPFDPNLIQPSSIDVRLDRKFLVFRNTKRAYIDVKQPADDLMEMIEFGPDEPMFLHPKEFVLGSTVERVRVPDDLVGRLEGRSSLGRLGIVIHSSLPYEEHVLVLDQNGVLATRPIGDLVTSRARGKVVGFDQDTLQVAFYEITNWFEELPDRIFEVRLASGRTVKVTAGHNLFTLDGEGRVVKTPTGALTPGTPVAIPARIPSPMCDEPELRVADLVSVDVRQKLVCTGSVVERALSQTDAVRRLLTQSRQSPSYWLRCGRLPLRILDQLFGPELVLGEDDRVRFATSSHTLPAVIQLDREFAWLLGLYVAEGYRRRGQVVLANTDQRILDRAAAVLRGLDVPIYRSADAITCCSTLLSSLFEGLAMGGGAPTKRLPHGALGWPMHLLEALFAGLIDGDGSVRSERECLWTTSPGLVHDALLMAARLGRRAVTQIRPARAEHHHPLHVVSFARNRHKVPTNVPLPASLLVQARQTVRLSQAEASRLIGYRRATSLNNLERLRGSEARNIATLERVLDSYVTLVRAESPPIEPLAHLIEGDLLWDRVVEVVDTGRFETVYDLEVRSPYGRVENFLAGHGGILASNTAGFIDASFEGHVTLEISNLANLPIALYPGMRIGQISFTQMTTPAERPYGPARGSKYSGQSLPTASRLYLDFRQ